MISKTFAMFNWLDDAFDKCINWLFGTSTRFFEVFNATLFMSWAIAALVDPRMFATSNYLGFGRFPIFLMVVVFGGMSIMSVVGVFSAKTDMRFLGGYSLFLSSLVWGLVSVGFISSYPPLTTAMVLYPQLSLICFIVGRKIINECAKKGP